MGKGGTFEELRKGRLMEVIETVDEHCKHPDCVYRMKLVHGYPMGEFCNYSGIMGRSRGCSISECDKYRAGRRSCRMTRGTLEWRIDDDILR